MALSGSKTISVTSYNTLTFSWSASQSVSGNYSTVSWKMVLKSTTYGRISSSTSKSWSVNVNGSSYSGKNTVGISANSSKTLASGSTRVNHNADGTKSFSFSFSQEFAINFNGYVGTKSGSGSGTLNTIPRASSLTVPTINLGDSGTLTISRAVSSFTHTVTAKFGSYSQTIATKTTATSLTFTPPLEWANAIPNAKSGTCTYTIVTFNGSSQIGSKTVSGTLQAVESDVAPTINSCVASDAETDVKNSIGAYVQTKSKLKTVTSATPKYGATIKSYVLTFEGMTYDGATATSDYIKGSGTVAYTVTVTDSRGFTKTYSGNISVLAYTPPTITEFAAFRCNDSGTAIDDGVKLNVTRNWQITPLNNKNANSWALKYRKQGATTWVSLTSGTGYSVTTNYITTGVFDVDYPYELQVTVADKWNSASLIIEIPTAFTLVDYHSSGKGIAFGKVAETTNLFDVDFPMLLRQKVDLEGEIYDEFGTRINNGLVRYTGSGDKAIDSNTTTDELILTDKNTPWSGFAYIRTMFYGSKSTTSARAQVAYSYSAQKGMAHRFYFNGAWSAWEKNVTIETVWENASPNSTFASQTLKIEWQKYNELGIVFRHYGTATYVSKNTIPIHQTFTAGFINSTIPVMNRFTFMYGRTWKLVSEGINFGSGYMHDTAINTADAPIKNDGYAIPITIYGVKN